MSAVSDAVVYLLKTAAGAPADPIMLAKLVTAVQAESTPPTGPALPLPGFDADSAPAAG